ncbi:uncharacterized protein LOC118749448 [Rhagoletis pomonella]|uniref:uncharacterized protein LOC118749448 n=1 Tax=Rhagoletis pomonella TaxID=28610 RepID=UPI00177F341C|nr:uncharacterized protein LOC118749448 [Rhagoletis pomonella]
MSDYKNKTLTHAQREDIINIVLEEVISKNINLRVQDFPCIVDEICSIFPSEVNMQDYYFISRQGRNNPSGKLYSKYKNQKSKHRKVEGLSESSESKDKNYANRSLVQTPEVDESISEAYKTSLNRDCADWAEVCDKWKKTFHLRQRDLCNLSPLDFFQAWSKLSHAQASDLIEIDFQFMYPEKTHLFLVSGKLLKQKLLITMRKT